MKETEIAIVGGGILGMALAYAAAKKGKEVSLFERDERSNGASIRNFGMIWPIGQAVGEAFDTAIESRHMWEELALEAGFWYEKKGSLLLARKEDEWTLAQEFYHSRKDQGYELQLLNKDKVGEFSPCARTKGLLGGLLSKTELIIDPREACKKIAQLLQEKYAVSFYYKSPVGRIEGNALYVGEKKWRFGHAYLATGADIEGLFPVTLGKWGIKKTKLQMMATGPQPNGWRMDPAIYGGLTLQHYKSFAHCPGLPSLKKRISEESPWFNEWGIHVMMSQNGRGELLIGDSHEYGDTHDPFIREEINRYILDYLDEMVTVPNRKIARRWYGVYAKLDGAFARVEQVQDNITLVNGVGGAGMSLSLGLAKRVVERL